MRGTTRSVTGADTIGMSADLGVAVRGVCPAPVEKNELGRPVYP
jgi:hypothetical protein